MQQVDAGEDVYQYLTAFLQVYNWTGLADETLKMLLPYRTFIELTEMLIQY
jgi:hypothetical protein